MNIENALIHSYAMLVMRGRCRIADIPEEYRTEVRDFITVDMEEPPVEDLIEPVVVEDKGPLTLPKIQFSIKSGETVSFKESDIFTEEVLSGKETPDVVKYDLVRVEPQIAFDEAPKMVITKTISGFDVKVTGTPRVFIEAMPSVVGTVKVKTSNYEDMNLSIYATIEE